MTNPDDSLPTASPDPQPEHDLQRLWTPWRMQYVGGGTREAGCIFCNRLASDDDVTSLIVHRGEYAFAIMNLYPYNTGHLMIVPNTHVGSPEDASPEELAAVATMLQPMMRALRRALNPAGFNVGMNVGGVAGAGVADHLHLHVVPRWAGDANFMPILGGTMVLPELIPATYAKVRIEIERDLLQADSPFSFALVVLDNDARYVLVRRHTDGPALPEAVPREGEAIWTSVSAALGALAIAPTLVGWAGAGRAGKGPPALDFVSPTDLLKSGTDLAWMAVEKVMRSLPAAAQELVRSAKSRHGASVVAPPG